MMKKTAIVTALLIIALFGIFKLLQPKLVAKAFETRIQDAFSTTSPEQTNDGLHVFMCGAGSPLPDPQRGGPCIGVLAGQQAFIFDTGSGGNRQLAAMQFPMNKVEAIFLTHFHSDHIDGLGEILMQSWVAKQADEPMPVYGPIGTARVVEGFNQAYALDQDYRLAHHGPKILSASGAGGRASEVDLNGPSKIIYQSGDTKITAFKVSHEPVSPAFGYRVDYKNRAISISGDTKFDPNVAAASQNVDILFHEALNMQMVGQMRDGAKAAGQDRFATIFNDILDYHTSPVEAAKIASLANAEALVLYHIVPMLPSDALIPMFVQGASDEFSGHISVSKDGKIYSLPAGDKTIIYK